MPPKRLNLIFLPIAVYKVLLPHFGASAAVSNARESFRLTRANLVSTLKSPPLIDTLLFTRTLHQAPIVFPLEESAKMRATLRKLESGELQPPVLKERFALRTAPNGRFILQQLRKGQVPRDPMARNQVFAGRDATNWWTLTKNGVMATDSSDGTYTTEGSQNDAFVAYKRFAQEFLRFGLHDIEMASITLIDHKGDSMKLTAVDHDSNRVTMDVQLSGDEVSSMLCTYKEPRRTIGARLVRFQHQDYSLINYTVSDIHNASQQTIPYAIYNIEKTSLSAPNSPASCSANQFLTDDDFYVVANKSGVLFDVRLNGLPISQQANTPGQENAASPIFLITVTVATLAFFLVINAGRRRDRAQ